MKIEIEYKKELPSSYLVFLNENLNGCYVAFNDNNDHNIQEVKLFGESDLFENMEMTGIGNAMNFEILKLFIKFQRDFGFADVDTPPLNDFEMNRVESGFVFGGDYDGYLFLDTSNKHSVWFFFPENGKIVQLADSFEDFIKNKVKL